ncbi:senescence-specific cysteine protease sag39 [Cucumis melo var. makuwa]|uniref:Senescence-specific cysteine protease sag39 n=1 Tax=Cucumis melo var. makuwa TaxID=1194695 RepID=A0A5A7TTZ3_CUCMM|nr:senescence-specific cysteine protease sag39 [Cucumis melo var. makuwa]TYK03219.1 senescence-specific cysteine protease sag39 [Cucumis melo var. makuwa]
MSSANPLGKAQRDRLVELEEQMRAMVNQAPAGGSIPVSRVKIPEPKPFCGARDAKALENYIFDLEQYFRATNTVTEEAKVTLVMMHLSEDAKV